VIILSLSSFLWPVLNICTDLRLTTQGKVAPLLKHRTMKTEGPMEVWLHRSIRNIAGNRTTVVQPIPLPYAG